MSLEVLEPGWASRVVDTGRPASRSLGVPVGGAADRTALALGNALIGNPEDSASLEVCLSGPRLHATSDVAAVVYGAPFQISIQRDGGVLSSPCGKTFALHQGDELRIGGTPVGMRAYLCVRGGFQTPLILGSRSGLDAIKRREILPCLPSSISSRFVRHIIPHFDGEYVLRVLPGLQASWFRDDEFHRQQFTVAPASNRMGLRLQGEPLTMPVRELVSEPVAPGAVQVTRDGQCIVLGIDGQTIGGYPKVAHVIAADLDRLGQLRPGNIIRFVRIAPGEASAIYRHQHALLRKWTLRLRSFT